ncbi:TetR/AcrR family transcriptional regulator [Pontivivens insulae]|uniref:HTH-type transcriptional repressor n=1 Tax=Pontivivens insulae TaxID=1639689 RepID=A0A2R8AFG2_9RHOB|nr:TetR/AcrR family transcriptional regulator [Pontivivens insulae]RED12082.1 TetR family transcriptional regulator [Pontivivens insulae]SPF30838.1 HTH-type transcriptional repressor [Pontivivens insulae]
MIYYSEMTEPKPSPNGRRKTTMARLVDAGRAEFSRNGFDRAKVQDIAAAAGANVALINRYFGSKRGLFIAVMQREVAEKQTGDLPYPPQPTLEAEARCWFRQRYDADRDARAMLRIVVTEALTNPEIRDDMMAAITDEHESNIGQRLHALQRAGAITDDIEVAELLRMMLLVAFSSAFMEAELLNVPADDTRKLGNHFAESLGARFGAKP